VHKQVGDVPVKRPQSPRPNGGSTGGNYMLALQASDANFNDKHGRPQLADAYSRGRGVHGNDELTDCDRRRLWLINWFTNLADRLRPVRVCCGHWSRVCDSPSTLTRLGTTAVFLDPPYRKTLADGTANRAGHIYANDKAQDVGALVDEVQAWCLKWGDDEQIRIAVCGLEGEYPELEHWEKIAWKSQGGYGNRNKDNENAARERIWFSPHCVKPDRQRSIFDALDAAAPPRIV
jgi:DNA adenine methylase